MFKVNIPESRLLKTRRVYPSMRRSFFKLFDDEAQVIQSFINAVSEGSFELAASYLASIVRKSCVLDYSKLKIIFSESPNYTRLKAVRFEAVPSFVRPNSILLGGNASGIVHLYTVFEPDKTSNWKIYAIERE